MIAALRSPRFYGAAAARAFDGYLAAQSFAPEMLGLRALYDHRGSSATKIVDLSGNGRADATVGAGSNSPLWLPYTVPAVHLPDTASTNNLQSTLTGANLATVRAAFDNRTLRVRSKLTPAAGATGRKDIGSFWNQGYTWYFIPSTRVVEVYTTISSVVQVASSVTLDPATTYDIEIAQSGNTFVVSQSFDGGVNWTVKGTATFPGAPDPATASILSIGQHQFLGAIGLHSVEWANGSTPFAKFDAALCGQSGHTDAYGNVWVVNRASAGRKTVVQSPAANSARGVWSLGTDDKLDVADAALPAFGTSGPGTLFIVVRTWQAAGTQYFCGNQTGGSRPGFFLSKPTSTATASLAGAVSGNGGGSVAWPSPQPQRVLMGFRLSATQVTTFANGVFSTPSARPANSIDSTQFIIGGYVGPLSGASDFELDAWGTADTELSNAALAQLGAFYGAGQ